MKDRILEDLLKGNEELIKKDLRKKREKLLKAFDIYKSNIMYGIDFETELEHLNVVSWYSLLLDLEEDAFINIPAKIARYLYGFS